MNINEAYDYIDLMVDKADQPYFTNPEKDIFLNLSITEFLSSKYALMGANQDFSEQYGNRYDLNHTSGYVQAGNYVELVDYHHITYAALNGRSCRIISDDKLSELRAGENPFSSINDFHPACSVVQGPSGVRIFFHGNQDANKDWNQGDEFNIRYLRHLDISNWDRIPEQYQYDVLNTTVRKLLANIESTSYGVQAHEAQQ